jgi:integrase/recombinase XerD
MKRNRFGQAEPLTPDQYRRVLSELHSETHRLIFALCWHTAERPITILRLKVSDVYQDAARSIPVKYLVIPRNTRKDYRTRELPISDALRLQLKAYRPPSTGFLFPGNCPDSHLSFSAYYKTLQRAFSRLNWQGFTTYSTRRGKITHFAKQGYSIRMIQAYSGHASLTSLQRYIEVDRDALLNMVEA